MFKPSPFKDAEVNPEPPQHDFRDFIGLIFSFFWFYRRVIVGLVLLAGLGFWIYRGTTLPSVAELDPTAELGPQRSIKPKMPVANIDFKTADDDKLSTVKPEIADFDPEFDTDPKTPDSSTNELATTDGQPHPTIENGTVEELIELSLTLRDQWGDATPSMGLLMCARMAKISRKLLEMELTDSERKFALNSYIESISLVDSLNVASKMKMDGPRDALLEVDETYSNHPDPTVNAKANLAMVLAPIYECIADEDPKKIPVIRREFDNRIDKIIADDASVNRLAEMTLALSKSTKLAEEVKPFIEHFLIRLEASSSPKAKGISEKLKERILYDKFELAALPTRLDIDDETTRKLVQGFFETLANNPNSSKETFQAAVTTIVKYQMLGKSEDAKSLIDWLDQISSNIPDPEMKRQVNEAIEKMRVVR